MSKAFWNDIELEKKKPFYLETPDDDKLLRYLRKETNLERCFLDGLAYIDTLGFSLCGNILDVGCGVGWTSAIMSQTPNVKKIVGLDYSQHRLLTIAPIVFTQLAGDISKFDPYCGDFYDLEEYTHYFDVILFCQSLYMFKELTRCLKKCYMLLAEKGIIMIACERITPTYSVFSPYFYKQRIRNFIKGRADNSGNYYYRDDEYRRAITHSGFDYAFQLLNYSVYNGMNILAGNHFGIKKKNYE